MLLLVLEELQCERITSTQGATIAPVSEHVM